MCIRLLHHQGALILKSLFCNHEYNKRWPMLLSFEKVHKATADFGVHLCENIRTRSRLWLCPKCQEIADSSSSYCCVLHISLHENGSLTENRITRIKAFAWFQLYHSHLNMSKIGIVARLNLRFLVLTKASQFYYRHIDTIHTGIVA